MPLGLVLWEWDYRGGAEILGKYPREVNISSKTLMQLYSQHLYSAKADIINMYVGALNVLSMWTGSTHNYFMTLLLSMEEDSDAYYAVIPDALSYLIPFIEQDTFQPLLPSIYQRFVEYPDTNEEQKRMILYSNDISRVVLKFLSEEGCYSQDELRIWCEETLKKATFNYEFSIQQLSSENMIKIENIKGIEGTYLFMLKKLVIFRTPPGDLQIKIGSNLSTEAVDQIKLSVTNYFNTYEPTERDNVEVANVLRQADYWRIIDILRKTNVNINTLNKLKLHGVSNISEVLSTLQSLDIIDLIIDQNNDELYYLKSDIIIDVIPMDFMLSRIYEMYLGNEKSEQLLLGYIKVLRDDFLANVAAIKSQKKKRKQKRRKEK